MAKIGQIRTTVNMKNLVVVVNMAENVSDSSQLAIYR